MESTTTLSAFDRARLSKSMTGLVQELTALPTRAQASPLETLQRAKLAGQINELLVMLFGVAGKEAEKIAKAQFKETLQGRIIKTDAGDVRFFGSSFSEMKRGMRNDALKAKIIPFVEEILTSGAYQGRKLLNKSRVDDLIAFHFFAKSVQVDDLTVAAGVNVGERADGLLAWGLGHEFTEAWARRDNEKKPPSLLSSGKEPEADGGLDSIAASPVPSLGRLNDYVNLVILSVTDKLGNRVPELEDAPGLAFGENMPQSLAIELTGKELGDFPEGAEGYKLLQMAGAAYFKTDLVNKHAFNASLKADVYVRSSGAKKIAKPGSSRIKLKLIPATLKLISAAVKQKSEPSRDSSERNVVAYHYMRALASVDGQEARVWMIVKEDDKGMFLYEEFVNKDALKGIAGVAQVLDGIELDGSALSQGTGKSIGLEVDSVNAGAGVLDAAADDLVLNLFIESKGMALASARSLPGGETVSAYDIDKIEPLPDPEEVGLGEANKKWHAPVALPDGRTAWTDGGIILLGEVAPYPKMKVGRSVQIGASRQADANMIDIVVGRAKAAAVDVVQGIYAVEFNGSKFIAMVSGDDVVTVQRSYWDLANNWCGEGVRVTMGDLRGMVHLKSVDGKKEAVIAPARMEYTADEVRSGGQTEVQSVQDLPAPAAAAAPVETQAPAVEAPEVGAGGDAGQAATGTEAGSTGVEAAGVEGGKNEVMTNPNDVVGNQGGRSADDTTPGAAPLPFADWFRGSKFVDAAGKPLVVYHGTQVGKPGKSEAIDSFSMNGAGSATWFTQDPKRAGDYANIQLGEQGRQAIYPVFLNLKNPLIVDAQGRRFTNVNGGGHMADTGKYAGKWVRMTPEGLVAATVEDKPRDINSMARLAKRNGHDGLWVKNVIDPADRNNSDAVDSIAVFDPENIRSAIQPNEPTAPDSGGAPNAPNTLDSIRERASLDRDLIAMGLTPDADYIERTYGKGWKYAPVPAAPSRAAAASVLDSVPELPVNSTVVALAATAGRLASMVEAQNAAITSALNAKPAPVEITLKNEAMRVTVEQPASVVNLTLPEIQPAPVTVNVTAQEPPVVHITNEVPAAQVVVASPARSVAVVQRDPGTLEIIQTVTTHEMA